MKHPLSISILAIVAFSFVASAAVNVTLDGTGATLSVAAATSARAVYAAFDTQDRGPTTNDWAKVVQLGSVPAGMTSLAGITLPDAFFDSLPVMRVFVEEPKSAADYVSDGLILLYDGIENAGWGNHDASAATWRNLVAADGDTDSDMPISESGDAVHADCVSLAAVSRATPGALLEEQLDALTIEANARPTWMVSPDANNMTLVRVGASGGLAFEDKVPISVWNRYSSDNAYWYIRGFGSGTAAAAMIADGAYRTFSAALGLRDDVSAFIDGEAAAYNKAVYSKDNANRAHGGRLDVQLGEMNRKARFDVRSVRVYSRKLDAAEIAANREVDAARFDGISTFEAGEPIFAPIPFTVVSARDDGRTLTSATLRFGASAKERKLHVSWSARDAGENPADWSNSAIVCTIPSCASALEVNLSAAGLEVPASAGVRFFIDSTSAADYVSDGLILLYDGIENAGWGNHDASAATWRNLVAADGDTDSDMPISESGDAVHADCVSLAAVSRATPGALLEAQLDALTIEANARPTWMVSPDANNMTLVRVGASGGLAFEDKVPISVWNRYSSDNAYWYIRGFGSGAAAAAMIADGAYRTFSAALGLRDDVSAFIDGEAAAYNKAVYSKDNANRAHGGRLDVQLGEMNKKARFDVHSVRVYSRKLDADEIAANRAVDAARFDGGVPVRVDAVSDFFKKTVATVLVLR